MTIKPVSSAHAATTLPATTHAATTHAATAQEAGIVLLDRTTLMYNAPSQHCVVIAKCPKWNLAHSVLWHGMPHGAELSFHTKTDCSDKAVYTTATTSSDGSHPFNKPVTGVTIKSFIVKQHSMYTITGIENDCRHESAYFVMESADATNSVEATSISWSSSSEGNLSANWTEGLDSEESFPH